MSSSLSGTEMSILDAPEKSRQSHSEPFVRSSQYFRPERSFEPSHTLYKIPFFHHPLLINGCD